MEGNGRRLAWIAIALSAVALVVSLSGRAGPRWHGHWAERGAYGPSVGQAQPAPGAPGWMGEQDRPGPRLEERFRPDQRFEQEFRGPGPFGHDRGFGPARFFFWPFMLLGKLIKLAFVVLLIWLGLRLLRGRGDGGRGGRGGEPPSRPGPEQPPYTGDTQQI
jgi:hypothetical protein